MAGGAVVYSRGPGPAVGDLGKLLEKPVEVVCDLDLKVFEVLSA